MTTAMRRIFGVLSALFLAVLAIASSPATASASTGYRILNVPVYYQHHSLDCETAALQMALAYEHIYPGENTLLNAERIDWRQPYWDSAGHFHWGDPNTNFVGNPNGSERQLTGYGTYAPNIARVARKYGGYVRWSGIHYWPWNVYQSVLNGHPVVAWVSFDWLYHRVSWYQAFDGAWVQFGEPYEHAVTVVGVTPSYVVINNPEYGRQWIPKWKFQNAYATFSDMAVVLN